MEIVGRILGMLFLMSAACGVGVVSSIIAYALLRKRSWQGPTAIAGLPPPFAMAYVLACLIGSAMLSSFLGTPDFLFGDIEESLPNGFHLRALDKMPEAGRIEGRGDTFAQVAWVGEVQISGSLVLGKYDYTCFPKTAGQADRNFFLFNTKSGMIRDFATEAELASAANTKLNLVQTAAFHGPRSMSQWIFTAGLMFIALFPPVGVGGWMLVRFAGLARSPVG